MAAKRLICKLLSLREGVWVPHEYLRKTQPIFKKKRIPGSNQSKQKCFVKLSREGSRAESNKMQNQSSEVSEVMVVDCRL